MRWNKYVGNLKLEKKQRKERKARPTTHTHTQQTILYGNGRSMLFLQQQQQKYYEYLIFFPL